MKACKICNEPIAYGQMGEHMKVVHNKTQQPKSTTSLNSKVLNRYQRIRDDLKQLIADIDTERNQIQQRLLELDTLADKYKKLL